MRGSPLQPLATISALLLQLMESLLWVLLSNVPTVSSPTELKLTLAVTQTCRASAWSRFCSTAVMSLGKWTLRQPQHFCNSQQNKSSSPPQGGKLRSVQGVRLLQEVSFFEDFNLVRNKNKPVPAAAGLTGTDWFLNPTELKINSLSCF